MRAEDRCGGREHVWQDLQLRGVSIIVVAVYLLVLAGCGETTGETTGNASFTASERAQLTSIAQRSAANESTQVQTAFDGGRVVSVTVTVGWTPQIGIGDIAAEQERVKTICFAEQRALWTSGIALGEASVTVLGPVQDDYADMILDVHALARLSAKTAATFSWATLTPDSAWSTYDAVWLRATYQPHVVGS